MLVWAGRVSGPWAQGKQPRGSTRGLVAGPQVTVGHAGGGANGTSPPTLAAVERLEFVAPLERPTATKCRTAPKPRRWLVAKRRHREEGAGNMSQIRSG